MPIILEIIDFETQKPQKKELNEIDTKKIVEANLKLRDYLNPALLSLDAEYSYQITGGTSISGFPLRSYVTGLNKIKQKIIGRKKPLTVQTNQVNAKTRVLNIIKKKRKIQQVD